MFERRLNGVQTPFKQLLKAQWKLSGDLSQPKFMSLMLICVELMPWYLRLAETQTDMYQVARAVGACYLLVELLSSEIKRKCPQADRGENGNCQQLDSNYTDTAKLMSIMQIIISNYISVNFRKFIFKTIFDNC